MEDYNTLLDQFVQENKRIFKDHLVGVYLHGSAAMGCFHKKKSDIDLLVVVHGSISLEDKRKYMDMVVKLNESAPAKGLELSILREEVCKPFCYPTPFELHFSVAHLEWYKTNPADYVEKMNGTDRDLAAHVTILHHRGKVLCGKEIKDVFGEVDPAFYFDSIWADIENAEEEIPQNPVYLILNLCRVLAYKKDGLILSKKEGGEWGLGKLPQKYQDIIRAALRDYQQDEPLQCGEKQLTEYAAYMIGQIKDPAK